MYIQTREDDTNSENSAKFLINKNYSECLPCSADNISKKLPNLYAQKFQICSCEKSDCYNCQPELTSDEANFIAYRKCTCRARNCMSNKQNISDDEQSKLLENVRILRKAISALNMSGKQNAVRDAIYYNSNLADYHLKPVKRKKASLKVDYKINGIQVCKGVFGLAYRVGKDYIDQRIKEIKSGIVCSARKLNELSKVPNPDSLNIKKIANEMSSEMPALTNEQISACYLGQDGASLVAYNWMARHFDLIGDKQPNRGGEIHLEPMKKITVYEEYIESIDFYTSLGEPVSYQKFCDIWNRSFFYVKIRKYKAVNGKCNTCAGLSEMRRKFRSDKLRQIVTNLHYLHRTAYMNERIYYYRHILMATTSSMTYMSTILDAMASYHTELPHFANKTTFNNKLPHSVTGVIDHGNNATLYRCHHNVAHGSNFALHAWLLSIERRMRENGGVLPDVLFHQIDGGSENANQLTFTAAELLISKRLCREIIITRLIPGHTHEDIDALFGVIWERIKDLPLLTHEAFERIFLSILRNKERTGSVKDIFCVPDYKSYFSGHGKKLERYAKNTEVVNWTQLQFRFQGVPISKAFPLGVKTTYRKYAADTVTEIVPDAKSDVQWSYRNVHVKYYPDEGEHILTSRPNKTLHPDQFIPGSRDQLNKCLSEIMTHTSLRTNKHIIDIWQKWFTEKAPKTDNVYDYVKENPLEIPLKDTLFSKDYIPQSTRYYSTAKLLGIFITPKCRCFSELMLAYHLFQM